MASESLGGHFALELVDQTGLADPGLTAQQYQLNGLRLEAFRHHPAELASLPSAANKRTGIATGRFLTDVQHSPGLDRGLEPFDLGIPGEVASGDPGNGGLYGVGDQSFARLGQILQAGG